MKLDTPKNLTERVLRSKKSTDEYNKVAHNARFDTDKDLMNCKMLRSQDFIYLVESKVEENEENEETASYGWWSMADGMSVNHISLAYLERILFSQVGEGYVFNLSRSGRVRSTKTIMINFWIN